MDIRKDPELEAIFARYCGKGSSNPENPPPKKPGSKISDKEYLCRQYDNALPSMLEGIDGLEPNDASEIISLFQRRCLISCEIYLRGIQKGIAKPGSDSDSTLAYLIGQIRLISDFK